MHTRLVLTLFVVAALGAEGCGCGDPRAAQPPNIVMLIADDQSWQDFGFMGHPDILTPNLDRLASEGVVFTHGFNTATTCRPSLRSLLTGLVPLQLDVVAEALDARGVRFAELNAMAQAVTLPERLAEAGYVSFQSGKYWEGPFGLSGFTEGMSTGEFEPGADEKSVLHVLSGGAGTEIGRATMEPVLEFIDRNAERPFFVWFAPLLPHLPHDPEPEFLEPYRKPRLKPALRRYYGNITKLDTRVGEILDRLDAHDLARHTIVVFLADNGWDLGHSGEPMVSGIGGARGKFSVYELGFRTPIVVRWPGHIAGGRRDSQLVSTVDLFPTLTDFAGLPRVASRRTGRSLAPALRGEPHTVRERVMGSVSRLRRPGQVGIARGGDVARDERAYFLREPGWRYVRYPERGTEELYAIDTDPFELSDVSGAHAERMRRYRLEVEAFDARMRSGEVFEPGEAP